MSGSDPAAEACQTSAEFDWSHPEADPSHPRYEPPHLRHRPGDTWQIGGKPFDIDDTGPYGNPLWRPDPRTGRHRRGELPDTLPPAAEPEPEPSPPPPVESYRTLPGPRRRGFWTETDPDRQRLQGPNDRERHHLESETDHPHQDEHRFDRLREDAWGAFMTDSAPLAAAHQRQPVRRSRQTAFNREAGLALAMWIRLAAWLLALVRSLKAGADPEAEPHQAQAAGKRRSRLARQGTVQGPTCDATPALGSVPSGRAAFPQPGVPFGPDHGQPTSPTVPRTSPARPGCATAMARAIAGAQRARAGVAAWA